MLIALNVVLIVESIMNNRPRFTQEQVDYICYQIGDWYLKWKGNITTGQHRLGIAKEELKSMICSNEFPDAIECKQHLWVRGVCFDCGIHNGCAHDWREGMIQECFLCKEQKEY